MILVRKATKLFGSTRALDAVDVEVSGSERVALFGPNGAGKTTLLRLMAGLHRPDSGTVTINSKTSREARGQIGYLGHEPQLYPQLSVRENLQFYARLYRVEEASAEKLMRRVGLDAKSNSLAANLSRGELQRASLAKTLLHDPDVVLADEVFTALDEESIAALPELLLREGRTIILATHDKDRAISLVDRIVTIEAGRIIDRG